MPHTETNPELVNNGPRHGKPQSHTLIIGLFLVVLILGIGAVYAIVTFSQATPPTPPVPSSNITPQCGTASTPAMTVNTAGSSINAFQGAFEFDCSGQPAFVSDGVSATPTWTYPNGLSQCPTTTPTTECLILTISTSTCGPGVSTSVLTSGSLAPIPKGSLVYCLIYEDVSAAGHAGYPSFTVSWS
jgi:hypothetical protein